MTELTALSLTYPDRETALQVARALSGNPDVETFPPDGWLDGVYYNITDLGTVYDPEGNIVPGYHLLGAWRGPLESVPDPVKQAHVADRPDWWPKLG